MRIEFRRIHATLMEGMVDFRSVGNWRLIFLRTGLYWNKQRTLTFKGCVLWQLAEALKDVDKV
jgi:hypothetical protein